MKANGAQIADVGVMVATDRQWSSHAPFGAPGLRSSFSKRASRHRIGGWAASSKSFWRLAPPSPATSCRHRGPTYSWRSSSDAPCWTYLNMPFVLAWPDVESEEAGSWREGR